MAEETAGSIANDAVQGDMSEAQKRNNVIRLAFGGDEREFEAFCDVVRGAIPPGTTVVLRGSAVTGERWKDAVSCSRSGTAVASDIQVPSPCRSRHRAAPR